MAAPQMHGPGGPGGQDYVLDGVKLGPPFIKENVEKVMKLDFDKKDILIVGYPKSGEAYIMNY